MSNELPSPPAELGKHLESYAQRVAEQSAEFWSRPRSLKASAAFVSGAASSLDNQIRVLQTLRPNIACGRGCSWCCHEVMLATTLEVLASYEFIVREFDEPTRLGLISRLTAHEAVVSPKRTKPLTFVRTPCPLLVEGECSIYDARPFSCRGMASTDANLCRLRCLAPGQADEVPAYKPQRLASRAAAKGLAAGSPARTQKGVHELGRCLLLLFNDPTLADRVLTGAAMLPTAIPGAPPHIFPLDGSSVSPKTGENPQLVSAYRHLVFGDYEAAHRLGGTDELTAAFLKIQPAVVYRSSQEIEDYRIRSDEALSFLEQETIEPLKALPFIAELSTLGLPYQGLSVKPVAERLGRIVLDKVVSKVYPHLSEPIEQPRKPGKFRLGYISGELTLNNGSIWALGWLRNHCAEIETYAFNLGDEDTGSKLWAHHADHYSSLRGNLQRIAEYVHAQDLDALIITDLGFRARDYVLFSMRLARVQCTAWGIPCTSGLPNIDYYLSSDLMEPEEAAAEYSETLIRLPRSGLCLPRPAAKLWAQEPVRRKSDFFPLMAQVLRKWTPQRDELLERIAKHHGKAVPLMESNAPEESLLVSERLSAKGIPHELIPRQSRVGFASLLAGSDVSYDPPDWSGGNTTVQALSYGVPVVTLPGRFMRGRHSMAFLTIAGAPGLIAKDEVDYLDLIFNDERRREAMKDMDADALFEDVAPVRALDAFLLGTV